jgi:uncharacterized protein YkwD
VPNVISAFAQENFMKFPLSRIFILLWFGCLFFPIAAKSQKSEKNLNKSAAAASFPQTQSKSESNTKTQNFAFSALETAVIEEINQARSDPQMYVAYLEEYRKYMKDNVLSMPNRQPLVTIEGIAAIDDAISELKKMPKGNSFAVSNGLSKVARQQVGDLQENISLKHFGKDGSGLEKRLMKIGFAGNAASENISYRVDAAREVILNMIIDDGIKSRSHRKNVFSPIFKLFGIACGVASDKTTVCVAEFADSFDER